MIYTKNTKKAIEIMYKAHKDQVDKSGMPYVIHPLHLAEQMKDEQTTIIALLHDVVEDSDMTFEELSKYFDNEIITALKLLTHNINVDYLEYIHNIKTNKMAKVVKIADLTHNSDITRLNEITNEDKERISKYKKALEILTQE